MAADVTCGHRFKALVVFFLRCRKEEVGQWKLQKRSAPAALFSQEQMYIFREFSSTLGRTVDGAKPNVSPMMRDRQHATRL